MGLILNLGLILMGSYTTKAQQIASTSDQALKNCGMFKFHKKKYLKGVRDFYAYREREGVTLKQCMDACCNARVNGITEFDCKSFSYDAKRRFCNLMSETDTSKIDDHQVYDFYLRMPFIPENTSQVSSDILQLNTPCLNKRVQAFRLRWANPIEPIENGPLIPACNYTDGAYLPKQCDPTTYEPENFPDFFLEDGRVIEANRVECFCVEESGTEIENTRTGPFERARLNCNHATWITHYIKWREHHFGKWIHTFKDYLKAKNYQNEKTARNCPKSVNDDVCPNTKRNCYDDYFGCRYCHCPLEYTALVNGTCSIERSNRENCLTKNGLKIESIQKCIAKECCFEVDQLTQDLKCFKPKESPSDEYIAINLQADIDYIDYIQQKWDQVSAVYSFP